MLMTHSTVVLPTRMCYQGCRGGPSLHARQQSADARHVDPAPAAAARAARRRRAHHLPEPGERLHRRPPRPRARRGRSHDAATSASSPWSARCRICNPARPSSPPGWWGNDPKHGWQFKALDYRTTLPATLQGMKRYLGSGLVKGIGPVMAGRIVDAFGEATFAVIDEDPERLTEVPGIGPVRAGRIAATWVEQRHIREVMAALQGYGISTSLAVRIYKRFGDDSARVIAQEPYRLAREVWGIGFKTADKIAQAVGIAPDAPERLQAGVLHALGQAADEGHTLLPEADAGAAGGGACSGPRRRRSPRRSPSSPAPASSSRRPRRRTTERTSRPADAGAGALRPCRVGAGLAPAGAARGGRTHPARPDLRRHRLGRRLRAGWPSATASGWRPSRRPAVRMALTSPVSILTGGPGTGKTHTLRADPDAGDGEAAALRARRPHRARGQADERGDRAAGRDAASRSSDCGRAARRGTGRTTRWRPTWSSSTRSACSMPCWPTSSSRRSRPAPICSWSAIPISCRAWGPATSWPICCVRAVPGHAPDAHLPPGGGQWHRRQRPAHQRGPAAALRGRDRRLLLPAGRGSGRGGADSSSTWSPSACPPATASRSGRSRCSRRCTAGRRGSGP